MSGAAPINEFADNIRLHGFHIAKLKAAIGEQLRHQRELRGRHAQNHRHQIMAEFVQEHSGYKDN